MYTQLSSSIKIQKNYTWKLFSFIAGVVDTAEQHPFEIISAKFWNDPKGILRGQGTLIYEKTLSRKSCDRIPLIL